jgi:hypothetical protein
MIIIFVAVKGKRQNKGFFFIKFNLEKTCKPIYITKLVYHPEKDTIIFIVLLRK